MTFSGHLEELRQRIMRAGLGIIAGMAIAWNFRQQLFAWLLRPLEVAWFCHARNACEVRRIFAWMLHPENFRSERLAAAGRPSLAAGFPVDPQIHFPDPTAAFVSYLKIAAIGGFVLALPLVSYQLWSFIAPGLYPREKKLILPFVFFSTAFFIGGSLFGYHFVFPVGYEWFLGFSGTVEGTQVRVVPTIMMDEYLSFTSQMLLAFGVVFELPLFVFFLSLAGLVTWRQLLSFGRYFTVIAFILAAVLTPSTDVYSQVALGLPLVGLYYVAVFLAYLFGPKKARKWRSTGDAPDGPDAPDAKAEDTRTEKEIELARIEKIKAHKKALADAEDARAVTDDAEQDARRAAKIRAWEDQQRAAKGGKTGE